MIRRGAAVTEVRHRAGQVAEVVAGGGPVAGDQFVSTLPIADLAAALRPPPPPEVVEAAAGLSYRDFLTVALVVDRADLFPDNWIYVHEPGVRVGRLQNFKNWSPAMVADSGRTCLGLEYFCFEGDGLWTMTDSDLVALAAGELEQLGLCRREEVVDGTVVRMRKAYPVYDEGYQDRVATVREWIERDLPNLHLCGRNGMHKYNNQDHSMMTALLVARRIAGVSDLDPWKVNTDAEYHEEVREGPDAAGRGAPARV